MPREGDRRARLLAVLSLSVLPWAVVFVDGYVSLVMATGLLDPFGLHLTLLPTYLALTGSGPPPFLLAWPIGVGIYTLTVVSVVAETYEYGDPRLTGGLLVLIGLTQLTVAGGFLQRGSYLVVPLGTLLAWTVAWWFYWPDIRAIGRLDRER